jgi:hypothetical protein
MPKYTCAFCGRIGNTPVTVTSGKCQKSPSGAHKVINEQSPYICKYCGRKGISAVSVVSGTCAKSPDRCHELME